jgi:type III pantothenate kinase
MEELDRALAEDGDLPLILTTVVPAAREALDQADRPYQPVGHPGPFPFTVGVQNPETVGADRYCNLAAVCDMGLKSAIVVDVGTATTIDVLEAGHFPGGMILPGPRTALSGLIQSTSQLPDIPLVAEPLKVGANTREAISRGAWHSALGGILWCVDGLQDQYGKLPVIATGGLVPELVAPEWFQDLHLTLRGAAYLRVFHLVDPS